MAQRFTRPLTEISTRNLSGGVKHGRRVRLTTSLLPESRMSKNCGTLDVSQPHKPPRRVTDYSFTFLTTFLSFLQFHHF
jgi:hypothetical protein